jgi:hypothetical protein
MTTSATPSHDHDHDSQAPEFHHRFLILGRKKLFFYHLALYNPNSGHNYQAVIELDIQDQGQLRATYLADLEQHLDQRVFYSLSCPVHFELPELKAGKTFPVILERVVVNAEGDKREFQQIPIEGSTATVNVHCRGEAAGQVFSFRKLSDIPYPDKLTYLAFGAGDEIHIAHYLARPKNFDEAVTIHTSSPIDPALLHSVPTLIIDTIDDPHGPINPSPLVTGHEYVGLLDGNGDKLSFKVGRQAWWNFTTLNNNV